MKIKEYIPEYEDITGLKVSPVVERFAEQLDVVGQRFENRGYADASQGKPVPHEYVFQAWGKKMFENDCAMAETMADILKLYYMDGYKAIAKRESTEAPA